MRIICTCLMLFIASNVFSQGFSISGTISDKTTGEILPFANIRLQPLNSGAITDIDGKFNIQNVPSGKYQLQCSSIGYKSLSIEIKIKNEDIYLPKIELSQSTGGPPVIVILPIVNVDGTVAAFNTPIVHTEITQKDIQPLNNGQDVPYLLRFTPSLVATSDAGNGVGYTGLWIRGSDPSRINVSINGIPLNDPESQQVFWVNTPDMSSNANNIQVQRGIGTSSNGAASFGGSIKIDTRAISNEPFATMQNSFGSFNTMKNSIAFGTGILRDHFNFEGRLSRITSDGYIDRAASNLKSFYLEGNYIGDKTTIKLNVFGGREETYQSWNGTPISVLQNNPDSIRAYAERNYLSEQQTNNLLNSGRTYNYYDYKNQVDHYGQDHYQMHVSHSFNQNLKLNISGHYTHGEGYFEEFKENQSFENYGLNPIIINSSDTIATADLVRRRWLKNDYFGAVGSLSYQNMKLLSIIGGAFSEYKGNHFGELTWMQYADSTFKDAEYYRGRSVKHDGNIYWRNTYTIKQKIDLYADLQLRSVIYSTNGLDNDLRQYDIQDNRLFFNPKAGIKLRPKSSYNVYASVAKSSKEPNRNDYVDAPNYKLVKPEEMIDIEAGFQYKTRTWMIETNFYSMNYKNQLVLTGELNDVGAPLRTNVKSSYRGGIELQGGYTFNEKLSINANVTLSENKIKEFNEVLYDYTNGFDVLNIPHNKTDISFSPSVLGAARIKYTILKVNEKHHMDIEWMSKYVGKQYLDNTENEVLSIDSYFVSDVRLGYEISAWQDVKLNFQLTAQNVFNHLYSSNGYTYSYVAGKRVTEVFYYPQAGRNYSLNVSLIF